ncbi:MAG: hypothetical protein APF76_16930 [Desulfitibacter sp. BRH_c19]|nr:MAG: hypothetical protein APF76_16930 [Desulfitibacter sp. BRH_c19]
MLSKSVIIKALELHLETAHFLKSLSRHNIYFKLWKERTRETLVEAFGMESEIVKQFESIKYFGTPENRASYLSGVDAAVQLLQKSLIVVQKDKRRL